MTHLDAITARQYRERRLPPDELLEASEHLAECDSCRAATSSGANVDSLLDALTEEALHLDPDQLASYVDGTLTPFERKSFDEHLTSCASCADDVDDLRRTAIAIAPRPQKRANWAVAAAVAAALILPATYFLTRPAAPAPQTPSTVVDLEADRLLRDARAGRIGIEPRAVVMRQAAGTLMGASESAFDVLAPVATFVRDPRPRFTWSPLSEGATYRVEIYADGKLAVQSPELRAHEWRPDADLARDREYVWQVVAVDRGQRVIAPRPPAPEAHFRILDNAALQRIADADRKYARQPLVRALLAVREGLLDEARATLASTNAQTGDARVRENLHNALR
jgi:hypothetical protein